MRMLVGPLLAPDLGGLKFTYYDAAGNATADPALVTAIDIEIRGESYKRAYSGALPTYQVDSLVTRVFLRG